MEHIQVENSSKKIADIADFYARDSDEGSDSDLHQKSNERRNTKLTFSE